jgi:hypothetical protein
VRVSSGYCTVLSNQCGKGNKKKEEEEDAPEDV